jgi:hypothetical protein
MIRIATALTIAFGLTWGAAEAQWIYVPMPGTPREQTARQT